MHRVKRERVFWRYFRRAFEQKFAPSFPFFFQRETDSKKRETERRRDGRERERERESVGKEKKEKKAQICLASSPIADVQINHLFFNFIFTIFTTFCCRKNTTPLFNTNVLVVQLKSTFIISTREREREREREYVSESVSSRSRGFYQEVETERASRDSCRHTSRRPRNLSVFFGSSRDPREIFHSARVESHRHVREDCF